MITIRSKVKSREEQVFSHHSFDEINLHPHLVSCLRDRLSITETTIVQQKSIPILMKGYDALIKSVTGSGKTLAYAVPIMNSLQRIQPKISRSDGVYCLILVPTRELAIQSFECFTQLSRVCLIFLVKYILVTKYFNDFHFLNTRLNIIL